MTSGESPSILCLVGFWPWVINFFNVAKFVENKHHFLQTYTYKQSDHIVLISEICPYFEVRCLRKHYTVLISKKCRYSRLASLFFLIFCSITILISNIWWAYRPFLSHRKHFVIKVVWWHKISIILQLRGATHYQALLTL